MMNFLTECLNKIDGDFLITSGREFHKTGPKQLLDSCFIFKLLSLFLLSRASDNTTSQNIGGTDAWAVSHLKFCWGTFPPVPPRSPPLDRNDLLIPWSRTSTSQQRALASGGFLLQCGIDFLHKSALKFYWLVFFY